MAFKGITAFVLGNNGEGGGGGGTTNYNDLTNHPQINGNELTGNKTADQLGLLPSDTDIPTKLSDLDEDVTHRTVTDLEKQSWNNKVDSVAGKGLSTNDYTDEDKTALANKVDKVTGKGLSTNDYTDGEKEDVAQVDGLVSSVGGLTSRVGIAEGKVRTLEGEMLSVQDALDTKVDKETGKGLSTNDYTNADKAIVDGVTTALAGKVDTSSVGTANGVAGLDNTGRVPSSQLPSYVDDVLEYASLSAFPATGEGGKIYIALDTNKTYRWSGSAYVEISESLALGETQGTAYEGNKGKANADAIDALETTVEAIPDQIETVVKDTVGWVGGNLLDKSKLTNAHGNTVTQIADGVIITLTINGNYISTNCKVYGDFSDKEIYLKYAYSHTGNVKPGISVRPFDANNNEIVNNRLDGINIPSPVNIHRTMPTGTAYLLIVFYGTYDTEGSIGDAVTYTDIMVSTTDVTYEPYHETVQEMFDSLGTASTKNSTSVVTDSSDLVESGAVKDIVGWGNANILNADVLFASSSHQGIKLRVSNQIISLNGTVSYANGYYFGNVNKKITLPAGTYTFSIVGNGNFGTVSEIRVRKTDDSKIVGIYTNNIAPVTFTLATDTEVYFAIVNPDATIGTTVSATIKIQLEKGSTATAYEPYHESIEETLRDAEVVDSANLWDEVWEYGSISGSDGTNISDSNYIRSKNYIPVDSENVYKIINGNRTGNVFCIYYNENKTHVGTSAQSVASNTDFSPNVNTAKYMRFTFLNNGNPYGNDVIFGYANEVTTYEPYYIPLKNVVPTKADNSVIGTVEDGTHPTKSYAVGEYMIRGGKFCTVTVPVTTSSTWVEGSNYTSGDVADELKTVTETYNFEIDDVSVPFTFYRFGKIVIASASYSESALTIPTTWTSVNVTVSEAFRKSITNFIPVICPNGKIVYIRITIYGVVDISSVDGSSIWLQGSGVTTV